MRQLTDAEREAVARLLYYSWLDIEFKYEHLTDREKRAVDPETFRTLAIFAREPRCTDIPDPPVRWR